MFEIAVWVSLALICAALWYAFWLISNLANAVKDILHYCLEHKKGDRDDVMDRTIKKQKYFIRGYQICRCGHRRLSHMWPKVDGACDRVDCACEGFLEQR